MLRPQPLSPADVADHLELRRLADLYCHAVDRGDLALLRSLYTEDAVDEHGVMFSGTADEYVAWLPKALAGVDALRHEVTSALYVVDGDRAQGQLVNVAYHRTGDREVVLGGRYLDTYARGQDGWRIRHRSLVLDWVRHGAASDQTGFIGQGVETGRLGPDDPVFARLDLFRPTAGE